MIDFPIGLIDEFFEFLGRDLGKGKGGGGGGLKHLINIRDRTKHDSYSKFSQFDVEVTTKVVLIYHARTLTYKLPLHRCKHKTLSMAFPHARFARKNSRVLSYKVYTVPSSCYK